MKQKRVCLKFLKNFKRSKCHNDPYKIIGRFEKVQREILWWYTK
jgi:Txe/YoeB family toxin of Txe-Axe toxin-antitoxin module